MKHILFILGLVSYLFSQDLIVSAKGDSIHCRILKSDSKYIYYQLKYNDEFRRTMLPLDQVRTKQIGYYAVPEIPDSIKVSQSGNRGLRLYAGGAYGYRTAKVDPDLHSDAREYIEELKTGYTVLGEVHYYSSEAMGYGVAASLFKSENEISSIDLSDDLSITFIGPSVQSRFELEQKNINFVSSVSIGMLQYLNESRFGESMTIEGQTLGLQYGLGLDFVISQTYGLTIGINYLQGTISKITVSSGTQSETIKLEKDNRESLNRIDLSLGVHRAK